jgi:hypothetical protein
VGAYLVAANGGSGTKSVVKDEVILPVGPNPPAPPTPAPITKLTSEQLYVARTNGKYTIVASPQGIVKVTTDPGPIRIRAKFVDGDGSYETRNFTESTVVSVEAVATGKAEIIFVPQSEGDIVRQQLDVYAGPAPPVPPSPPGPNPPPISDPGFRVLMVVKSPKDAPDSVKDPKVRSYLESHCVMGPDGHTKEWRIWDNSVDASGDSKLWQQAFARKRDVLPWILISDGKTGYEGPLPEKTDPLLALLKQYGGNF